MSSCSSRTRLRHAAAARARRRSNACVAIPAMPPPAAREDETTQMLWCWRRARRRFNANVAILAMPPPRARAKTKQCKCRDAGGAREDEPMQMLRCRRRARRRTYAGVVAARAPCAGKNDGIGKPQSRSVCSHCFVGIKLIHTAWEWSLMRWERDCMNERDWREFQRIGNNRRERVELT